MDTKICTGCKRILEIEEFNFANRSTGKRKPTCKKCQAEYFRKYRDRNPSALRMKWRNASANYYNPTVSHLKTLRKRGLTIDTYQDMYSKQDGCCAICKRDIRLVIDHCHDSDKVRGLVCNSCNLAIGYMEDDIKRLKEAIDYLNNAG